MSHGLRRSAFNQSSYDFWVQRFGTLNVKDFGAVGDGVHGDGLAIQRAINWQQQYGGVLYLPNGIYLLSDVPLLVMGPWPENAKLPLIIKGESSINTLIRVGQAKGDIFGIGLNGLNYDIAPLMISDITLDGNYQGVDQGAFPATSGHQLVSLLNPYTSLSTSAAPNGHYHQFSRVRFYRPCGYVFQPAIAAKIFDCVFDSVGQPDLSPSDTHYDAIGGGNYPE